MRAQRLLPRNNDPTGFTPALDELVQGLPEALCAVFVDGEGEAIDLATRIDPFDARVTGAELTILLARTGAAARSLGHGPVMELRLHGAARSILARHVGDGCDLVLMVSGQGVSAAAAERCAATAGALRTEAGICAPAALAVLHAVELRPSHAGSMVPRAFVEAGVRRRVAAVLGVREDRDGTAFLVRTAEGEEMLVVHDLAGDGWRRA